jgi:hypothetical protein
MGIFSEAVTMAAKGPVQDAGVRQAECKAVILHLTRGTIVYIIAYTLGYTL